MDICVDTSAILAVLLNEPTRAGILEATRDVELQSAPSLPWEVGNALSALFKRDRIDLGQARRALDSFRRVPIRLAAVDLDEALGLADEFGVYAYDAYMLVCALRYRMPLLSLDRSQCQVARALNIGVIEVER